MTTLSEYVFSQELSDKIKPVQQEKAHNRPWSVMPRHCYARRGTEAEIVEELKTFLEKNEVTYSYKDFLFTLLYTGAKECSIRIYRNEGPYAKDTEKGNYIVEMESLSHEPYYYRIFSGIEETICTGIIQEIIEAITQDDYGDEMP